MSMGLLWCVVAGVGCGINFLPVKKVNVGDGVFFAVCMSIGIAVVGLAVSFVSETEDSSAFRTMPTFEPYAMLGGAAWMLGNLMCPIIIEWIGLGIGLSVWDLTNMIVGWATGYFGLFNLPKDFSGNEFMNLAGISLAVLSLFFFTQARDLPEETLKSPDLEADPSTCVESCESTAPCEVPGGLRWMLGFTMALVAGCLFGYVFDPPLELAQKPDHSGDQLDYVWSHFAGIVLTGIVAFVVYVMVRGSKSFISKAVVLPAAASGAIWAGAQVAWFKANEQLSLSVTFPIISSLPGIISLTLGVCFFGELKSKRGRIFALIGMLVRFPAIALIAFSQ